MFELTITLPIHDKALKNVEKIKNLSLLNWFKKDALDIIWSRTKDVILKGIDRSPYVPLKTATLKRKKGRGKILVDSGSLLSSVTSKTGDSIVEVTPTSLTVGTSLIYARAHNQGYPPNNIPKRPFLFISSGMEKALQNSLISFVQKQIKGD